ncbi:MAG: hypothetical protein M5U32_13960 [Myxococcota bacterium]|nr:hypothetical protein [Myxococcota bacterium]
MNLKGEPAVVGRHCGSHRYEVTPELVRFYADALDDPSPLYRELAPSLLFHSECYKVLGEWYLANLFGNLHARQDWDLFQPIPIGAAVRTRSTIIERYHKRGRDYVVNETDVMADDDGRLLVRGRTHQSFLPTRTESGAGFVVDEKSAQKKQAPAHSTAPAEGPELGAVEKVVDARRCWMFSGPGRNYHTDADEARKLGFPNIVVQGMMSTCFVHQLMQDAFGSGWVRGSDVTQAHQRLVGRREHHRSWARTGRVARGHADACPVRCVGREGRRNQGRGGRSERAALKQGQRTARHAARCAAPPGEGKWTQDGAGDRRPVSLCSAGSMSRCRRWASADGRWSSRRPVASTRRPSPGPWPSGPPGFGWSSRSHT